MPPIAAALLLFTYLPVSRAASHPQPHDSGPQLWYQHHSYVVSDDALEASKKLVDHAVELKYNGVMFWDSGFNFISDDGAAAANEELQQAMGVPGYVLG